jgi:methyl-accepting chemotaxis protein
LNVLGESADTYLFNVDGLLYSNTDKEGYRFNSVLVDTITTEGTTNLSSLISEGDLETVQTRIYQGYHENDGLVIGSSKVIQFGNEYIGVIVELSEEEALGQVDLVSKTLFIVAGVVLLLGIIIGFLIIRAIVVPVNQVTKAAKNVAKGNMNVSLDKVLKRKDELGILAQSFKQVIDSNVEKAELIEYIALGELDKVEVKDTTDHVFKSILTVKENLEMFSSHVREDSKSILNGQFTEVIKDTGLSGIYADLISDVNNVMDGFKEKFDYLTTPFFIIDTDLTFIYANKSFEEMINHNLTDILGHPYYEYIGGINSVKEQTDGYKAINENRAINGNESLILDDEDYHVSFSISPITDQERQVVGAFATINDNTEITNQSVKLEKQKKFQEEQVKRLLSNIKTLSKGKFDMNFTEVAYDEDTREIHSLFAEIDTNLEESVNAISSYVAEISEVLTELSHSNLDLEVTREYIGEFGSIKDALNSIIESFNAVITNIYSTSNHVSGNAKSMNTSSVNLAQGATEQAAAIEEISATVTQVAAQINENAKNAQEVNEHARDAVLSAEQSNMMMSELTKAMKDVQKSTTNIQKVLKMINDISFQTNILSLNAAVEAARAGQHGKGFAVIAEDVRNLALKSANAADETTDMLDSIVSKINDAVKYANETATSLIEIVTNSKQSVDISSQVAVASNEQATAVAQINLSLDQISSVVQTTSSNAKDSEDVSKDLAHMSNQLMEVVSEFNTKGSLKKVQKQESFEEQPVITKQDDEDEIILNLDDLSF